MSGGLSAATDEVRQVRDGRTVWDAEAAAEAVPERDAELATGLAEADKGVAAVAPEIALGVATDVSPGDPAADIILRAVGIGWG